MTLPNSRSLRRSSPLVAVLLACLLVGITARADDGSLDRTFGEDGRVTTDFGGIDVVDAVAVQADGKVVVAGTTSGDENALLLVLARYTTEGALDQSFGNGGKIYASNQYFQTQVHGLTVRADGSIVVLTVGSPGPEGAYCMLFGYTANGAVDTSFGAGGEAVCVIDGYGFPSAISASRDGSMFVVGSVNGACGVVRLTATGATDFAFGDHGIAALPELGGGYYGVALTLQADGKLLVVGHTNSDVVIARLLPNGKFDSKFGAGGVSEFTFPGCPNGQAAVAFPGAVDVQPDGKVVVAGTLSVCDSSNPDAFVLKVTKKGNPDASFGTGGAMSRDIRGWQDFPSFVKAQRDGRIVVAGNALVEGTGPSFGIMRVSATGTLDETFGTGGVAGSIFASDLGVPYVAARGPNGSVVMAASPAGDFVVERYENTVLPPDISRVRVEGSQLFVEGRFFDRGSVVTVNGQRFEATYDTKRPGRVLRSSGALGATPAGQSVRIGVIGSDGVASLPHTFRR